jgi:hypothetical protein
MYEYFAFPFSDVMHFSVLKMDNETTIRCKSIGTLRHPTRGTQNDLSYFIAVKEEGYSGVGNTCPDVLTNIQLFPLLSFS